MDNHNLDVVEKEVLKQTYIKTLKELWKLLLDHTKLQVDYDELYEKNQENESLLRDYYEKYGEVWKDENQT